MNKYTKQVCEFWVKNNSRHVTVDKTRISLLRKKLRDAKPKVPDWQMPDILPQNPAAFISHNFFINTVNFAFTHFEPPYDKYALNKDIVGALASSACFYRRFGEKPINPDEILDITSSLKKTKKFFQGINLPPLIEERRLRLRIAAGALKVAFDGRVENILKAAKFNVNILMEYMMVFFSYSYGSDYYKIPGIEEGLRSNSLFLNKRIQLWMLIHQGRAIHSQGKLPLLKYAEDIGPVADYQVPRYLYATGVLKYSPSLLEKIERREIIPYGCPEEIEIRCATIFAVCELLKKTKLTMMEIDYFLWAEGRKIQTVNHHLTPTTAY
ncbi:MAG: queuosine salvage family protein [Patescibacteria group bacterium]